MYLSNHFFSLSVYIHPIRSDQSRPCRKCQLAPVVIIWRAWNDGNERRLELERKTRKSHIACDSQWVFDSAGTFFPSKIDEREREMFICWSRRKGGKRRKKIMILTKEEEEEGRRREGALIYKLACLAPLQVVSPLLVVVVKVSIISCYTSPQHQLPEKYIRFTRQRLGCPWGGQGKRDALMDW